MDAELKIIREPYLFVVRCDNTKFFLCSWDDMKLSGGTVLSLNVQEHFWLEINMGPIFSKPKRGDMQALEISIEKQCSE